MNNSRAYKKLKQAILDRWPDVKIKHKQDYDFWKMVPIDRQYSSITLGNTIWMGTESFATLAHEARHMERIQREGKLKFYFKYLFPQILGAIVLLLSIPLFIWSTWIVGLATCIASLFFFIPWPATVRSDIEFEAYSMNMAIERWTTGKISDYTKLKIYDAMIGRFYYKMTWDEEEVMEDIEAEILKIVRAPKTYAEKSYLNMMIYDICKEESQSN